MADSQLPFLVTNASVSAHHPTRSLERIHTNASTKSMVMNWPEDAIFHTRRYFDLNDHFVPFLPDCPLVTFVRPYFTERVPVVSLPVSAGQLIHPGAHLIISGRDRRSLRRS